MTQLTTSVYDGAPGSDTGGVGDGNLTRRYQR
jgi:hypothetical protein